MYWAPHEPVINRVGQTQPLKWWLQYVDELLPHRWIFWAQCSWKLKLWQTIQCNFPWPKSNVFSAWKSGKVPGKWELPRRSGGWETSTWSLQSCQFQRLRQCLPLIALLKENKRLNFFGGKLWTNNQKREKISKNMIFFNWNFVTCYIFGRYPCSKISMKKSRTCRAQKISLFQPYLWTFRFSLSKYFHCKNKHELVLTKQVCSSYFFDMCQSISMKIRTKTDK